VTVWAFYDRPTKQGIPLLLINRTDKTIELSMEGQPYLMLEYKNELLKWQRAQPHTFSWCGNSYSTLKLEPNSFYRAVGYAPKNKGTPAEVRYTLYLGAVAVSSNTGAGFVDAADIATAETDAMAIAVGDFEFVSKVALGTKVLGEKAGIAPRMAAIRRLTYEPSFDRKKTEAVLEQIAAKKDDYSSEAIDALNEIHKNDKKDTPPEK